MPELRSFDSSRGRLTYILSGTGAARIVLVNGAGMTLRGWRRLYPRIERMGQVLAFNRFGVRGTAAPRGPLDAATVAAVLGELLAHTALPPPFVLVGHSLGALHAELFARLQPQQVAGLVLVAPARRSDPAELGRRAPQFGRALAKALGLPQQVFGANLHAELQALEASLRQLRAAPPLRRMPVQVVEAERGHFPQLAQPRRVLAALALTLRAARARPAG